MKTILSKSQEQTYELGKKIASLVKAGDILCLKGELGAGKTALSKGIGAGLGIEDYITSPSYTIINEYNGRLPLYHFDVYRINDMDEMYELGYEDYFNGRGICVIEWADSIKPLIPKEAIWIELQYNNNENEREIIIYGENLEEKL